MTLQSCLVIVLVAVAHADAVCSELGTCADGEVFEETPVVSMLQTEMHVSKGMKSKMTAEVGSASTGAVTTSSSAQWMCIALVLFTLAGACGHYGSATAATQRAQCTAEFLGTFMLVFSVGCNVLVGDKTWGVTSIACTLMVSIYALGGVSGANFNPAVSVALGLSKKMAPADVGMYVCVQLASGILAALAYGSILGKTMPLAPSAGHTLWDAGLAELLYTFMLTFVVLNVAASKEHAGKNQFYGLAIGFTVVAGGYGAGTISGGCFNPAIALGIDSSSSAAFGNCISYIAFEIVGCGLASAFFRVCRPKDFDEAAQVGPSSKLTSEFLGTYMLVLTVGLNVLGGSPAGAFSIASALMCMIFALGSCSGAHFNPAVTVAIVCSGRQLLTASEVVTYILAQVLGGVSAAFTAAFLVGGKTAPLAPNQSAHAYEALVGELIFTFLLCFVVLSVATTKAPLSEYFGLAIGACVIAGGYAIGNLSGGSLNPAVSAGLAISDSAMNGGPIEHMISYSVVEIVGGILAAGVFQMTHSSEYAKEGV